MELPFKKLFSSFQKTSVLQPKKVVGIDFGASSIKVVEVQMLEGVITLSTYGELQLGPYANVDMGSTIVLPMEKKIEALVDVIRESGVTAIDGVFALPLADSFVTVIEISAKKDEDISPRVHVESRKYIPIPLSEVALEWVENPRQEKKDILTREIMLAAVPQTSVTALNKVLEAVKMASKPAEIELFSALRSVTVASDTTLAVIDLGAQTSKLYIAEGGFLRRIHRIQTGGADVTKILAKELSVSFEEAENIKRNYNPTDSNGQRIKQIVERAYTPVLQEFQRVISQYELRIGAPIARVSLTGGVFLFSESVAIVRHVLGKEVTIANPFTKIAYPAFLEDTLVSIAPVFTVALGAALRQFEK